MQYCAQTIRPRMDELRKYTYALEGELGQRLLCLDGAMRSRTADPYHAMVVLYQLSYNPLSL